MANVPSHGPSEVSLSLTLIGLGTAKLVNFLVQAEPVLASLSYIVAIAAGLVTLYFKFKNRR